MSVQILRTIPGINTRGFIAEPGVGLVQAIGLAGSFDNNNPQPGDDPYDLSGLTSLGWTVVWPTLATPTNTITVSTIGDFQTYASAGNYEVTVSTGSYSGNVSIGTNTKIIMSNSATLTGNVSMNNKTKLWWVGGNIVGKFTLENTSIEDVLIDNLNLYGRFETVASPALRRLAIINSTFDGNPLSSGYGDFMFYIAPNDGAGVRYADIILANVKMDSQSTGNGVIRIQKSDRVLIYESAFGIETPNPISGQRFGQECDYVHVEDTLVRERIFLSLNEEPPHNGLQQVDHGRFENVTRYFNASTSIQFATFFPGNVPSVGVVNNSQMYTNGTPGSTMDLGDFTTESGNPTTLAYSSLPDVSSYGADH